MLGFALDGLQNLPQQQAHVQHIHLEICLACLHCFRFDMKQIIHCTD